MTANQIRYNILLAVDSLFEGTAPGYNDTQMSAIINRAQRRVFRDKARIFDTDEKVKRMLSPLIRRGSLGHADITATADPSITNYNHSTDELIGTFYTLPTGVGRIIEEYVTLEDTTTHETYSAVLVLPITYDYFLKNFADKYKKPYYKLVWRLDSQLESTQYTVELIYSNDYTVEDFVIAYLKYPDDIKVDVAPGGSPVDCEITDTSFQDEIIGEAVKIITASLNDEGYQIPATEKKFDEN